MRTAIKYSEKVGSSAIEDAADLPSADSGKRTLSNQTTADAPMRLARLSIIPKITAPKLGLISREHRETNDRLSAMEFVMANVL
jgi:hypothetical protein